MMARNKFQLKNRNTLLPARKHRKRDNPTHIKVIAINNFIIGHLPVCFIVLIMVVTIVLF
jgi:hypothetical protein